MHILLIEDDDRVAAALRPALHRHGMTTTRLDHGRGAVDHLDGVDVVLLDLGLPDADGLDVCRAIRAVSEGRADYAVIDCVSWDLARQLEPASSEVHVAGWASSRPGLPLITSLATGDEEMKRMRRAVMAAMEAVVLDSPFLPSRLPDQRP